MIDVVNQKIVLPFFERFVDASPQLILAYHRLVFGPLMEMLVFDTNPLITFTALSGCKKFAILWIQISFVNVNFAALSVVD